MILTKEQLVKMSDSEGGYSYAQACLLGLDPQHSIDGRKKAILAKAGLEITTTHLNLLNTSKSWTNTVWNHVRNDPNMKEVLAKCKLP